MELETLLLVLAILGGVDLAARGVTLLSAAFPPVLSLQARAWRLLSDGVTLPALRRKALGTRVEEVLNQTAFHLQKYLPKGWVKRARVRWVRREDIPRLREDDIVLRVRPERDADHNLMNALWVYFRGALFPDTKDILPRELVSAIALAVTRAGLEEHHPYLLGAFDRTFVTGAELDVKTVAQFSDCVRLNDYGLLMGPFLREVDQTARRSRFSSDRDVLPERLAGIAQHMLAFQPVLRLNKPDEEWVYQDGDISYGFLLVSRPPSIRPGIDAYIKRAQSKVQNGVGRIYVIGRDEERAFVHDVVAALLSIRELRGVEVFPLFRDYRGTARGIGALLNRDEFLASLAPARRSLASIPLRLEAGETSAGVADVAGSATTHDPRATAKRDLISVVEQLAVQLSDYEGAWISLAEFGLRLRHVMPDFSPERYGGRNLMSVLKRLDLLEFDERGAGPAKAVYVRLIGDGEGASTSQRDSAEAAEERVLGIVRAHTSVGGWLFLGTVGHYLKKEYPEFDCSLYGAASLHDYVTWHSGLEIEERGEGKSLTYVRARQA